MSSYANTSVLFPYSIRQKAKHKGASHCQIEHLYGFTFFLQIS